MDKVNRSAQDTGEQENVTAKYTAAEFFAVLEEVDTRRLHTPVIYVLACDRNLNEAVMLQQVMYWRRKMRGPFYKRHGFDAGDGWEAELGLAEQQTRRAARALEARGLISTRVGHGRDNKRATFYDVDFSAIVAALVAVGVDEFEWAFD